MNKKALLAKLKAVVPETDAQRNTITCSLIGHSRILSGCFGYWYCGRCEAQLGDSLGGVYSTEDAVIIGHACDTCRKNYAKLDWRHKLFVADPFKTEEAA